MTTGATTALPRTLRLSEAIHCFLCADTWIASPSLAMTAGYELAPSRGADSPEVCISFGPLRTEGAGKTGCLLHPRSRVRFAQTKLHTSIQGSWSIRPSLRNGFTVYFVLSPENGSFASVALNASYRTNLTPAPRRPNHTTSPYAQAAHVSRSSRVHRISPRVVTIASAPQSGETSGVMPLICAGTEAEYF